MVGRGNRTECTEKCTLFHQCHLAYMAGCILNSSKAKSREGNSCLSQVSITRMFTINTYDIITETDAAPMKLFCDYDDGQ